MFIVFVHPNRKVAQPWQRQHHFPHLWVPQQHRWQRATLHSKFSLSVCLIYITNFLFIYLDSSKTRRQQGQQHATLSKSNSDDDGSMPRRWQHDKVPQCRATTTPRHHDMPQWQDDVPQQHHDKPLRHDSVPRQQHDNMPQRRGATATRWRRRRCCHVVDVIHRIGMFLKFIPFFKTN